MPARRHRTSLRHIQRASPGARFTGPAGTPRRAGVPLGRLHPSDVRRLHGPSRRAWRCEGSTGSGCTCPTHARSNRRAWRCEGSTSPLHPSDVRRIHGPSRRAWTRGTPRAHRTCPTCEGSTGLSRRASMREGSTGSRDPAAPVRRTHVPAGEPGRRGLHESPLHLSDARTFQQASLEARGLYGIRLHLSDARALQLAQQASLDHDRCRRSAPPRHARLVSVRAPRGNREIVGICWGSSGYAGNCLNTPNVQARRSCAP